MPLIITGCARPDGLSARQAVTNVGLLVLIVIAVIAVIVIAYKFSIAAVGVCVGLICGAAIILSVPIGFQYAFIGAVLGIGGDFLASSTKKGGPTTMIESLSSFIVSATQAAQEVGNITELEQNKKRISQLIWSAVGTVVLMLIVGRIFTGITGDQFFSAPA